MSIYFQFKSSTVRESMPIDGPCISAGELKHKIQESKLSWRGRKNSDSTIVLSDHKTHQDYSDDSEMIVRNSTVWARRVPVISSLPILVNPVPVEPEKPAEVEIDPDEQEWEDIVAVINGKPPSRSENAPAPPQEMDEDSKIKALVETPALDWQGYGGRVGGASFGWKAPPPGYVCHRCKKAGHLMQHCPTNGDPAYDVKKFRPPTGIPKSMLSAAPDGSYALPNGAVAVLKPNEAAFDKEMEGVSSSSRSATQLPPELHCRLCKQVMKDAVLTSRCCFDSFCDRCIRGHIISKSSCVCGATNVLADHLIPNVTLRKTISSILESVSGSSSGEGVSQVENNPSTHESAASKQVAPPPEKKESEAESQGSAPLADEQVEQKPEAPKEEVKATMPVPIAANNNFMMPPPVGYNPYWGGMNPYWGGYGYNYGYGYNNYGYGPMPSTAMPKMEPNAESRKQGMPYTEKSNAESRESNLKRKRNEKDEEHAREVRSRRDMKSSRSDRPPSKLPEKHHHRDHSHHRDHRDDRYKRDEHHHRDYSHRSSSHHRSEMTKTKPAAESKKSSVCIPHKETAVKKQNLSSSSYSHYEKKPTSVSSRKSVAPAACDESSDDDDDRHFKRRRAPHNSSPSAPRLMMTVI